MFWLTYILIFMLSYLFGSFAFPQIIGSIRMIVNGFKKPYTFTLILWSVICVGVSLLVYFYLPIYFMAYIIALITPLVITLFTKNIE